MLEKNKSRMFEKINQECLKRINQECGVWHNGKSNRHKIHTLTKENMVLRYFKWIMPNPIPWFWDESRR